jgi:hypothetical protein
MESKRGWSSWSTLTRVLVVLAIGTGIFMVISTLAGAFAAYWLYAPGEQTDTRFVISGESLAYAHLAQSAEDPGIGDTLARIDAALVRAERNQRQNQEHLPAPMRALMDMSQQSANVAMFFPRSATLSLEPDPEGEVLWLAGVNPRGLGGFIRAIFMAFALEPDEETEDDVARVRHGEHLIVETASIAWTNEGSTVFAASTIDAMKGVVDRVEAQSRESAHAKMLAMEKQIAPGSDAFAVVRKPRALGEEVELPGLSVLGVGLDVVTADRWEIYAIAEANEGEGDAMATGIRAVLDNLRLELADDQIAMSYRESPVGPRTLRFEIDLLGVGTAIARGIEEPDPPVDPVDGELEVD